MKLATKLMLMFLLAVAVIAGLFCYLTIRQDAAHFAEEHERHAADLVESLQPHLMSAWSEGGHGRIAQFVEASNERIRRIRIRYVQMDVQFESDSGSQRPPGLTVPDSGDDMNPHEASNELFHVRHSELVTEFVADANGDSRISTLLPLSINGRVSGGIDVSREMQPVEDRTRSTIIRSILSVIAVAVICGGMLMLVGIRMVGRPLTMLVEKTRRAGQGDFGEPLMLSRTDELGELAVALNEMCCELDRQRETIQNETAVRMATQEQLRHADRLKTVGRLASGIAHEMGTPLNVVSGRAGLIASRKLTDDEVQQSAVVIKTEADRITKIIRELLDFARRETPRRTLEDLPGVVRQTVELLRGFAEQKNIKISIESQGESLQADIDPGQIQQVITNLVMNAIQSIDADGAEGIVGIRISRATATPPGGIALATDDYFQIEICDNGSGMVADRLNEIFEPFFTTKDVGKGTGLGLSVSWSIVQEHDGWIGVTSEPGQGSCFTVYLPVRRS